jgi:subtilisin-like proprotein convertase family protein
MAADYLIWIQHKTSLVTDTITIDGQTIIVTDTESTLATLMTWNEGTGKWETVTDPWDYYFGAESGQPASDIYLPFGTIGIGDPASSSLSLVAFAVEEEGLRLWATIPNHNAVNSDRVLEVDFDGLHLLALTQRLAWSSLSAGVCPNVVQSSADTTAPQTVTAEPGQYTGADVTAKLSAAPVGAAYGLLDDGYFFIMDELRPFENLVDWQAELAALCAFNPASPDCERAPVTSGNLDFAAAEELGFQLDADHPPLSDGDAISYTLELVNRGTGPASGIVADVVTWGPIRLPAGTYGSATIDGELWEWDNLVLELGDLAPGEIISVTFTSLIDVSFDSNNLEGLATIDVTLYDDTGSLLENQLEWLFLDHPVDDQAPAYIELLGPESRLITPGINILEGMVRDASAVEQLELLFSPMGANPASPLVSGPNQATFTEFCLDPTPDDGSWSCVVDFGAVGDGAIFSLDARAVDSHGLTSDWSSSYAGAQELIVDAAPPTVTLDAATASVFGDGIIGPDQSSLSGRIEDNHLVSAVDVCQVTAEGEVCESADLTLDSGVTDQALKIYEDVPETPLPTGANAACGGGTEILRTFSVTETFTVANVDVGLNLSHPYRHDLEAYLTSPAGTEVTLLRENSAADNYDILLDDAARLGVGAARSNHDPAAPFYENEVSPDGYLSAFNQENATGTWMLRICDNFPGEDDGTYNRSRLILQAEAIPENTAGSWHYALPLTDEGLVGEQQLTIYGLDSIGNRSQPLALTYRLDTVAPLITVTNAVPTATASAPGAPTRVMTGTVSDDDSAISLEAGVTDLAGNVSAGQVNLAGDSWTLDIEPQTAGLHTIWVYATDSSGNTKAIGPFEVDVSIDRKYLFLPMIVGN